MKEDPTTNTGNSNRVGAGPFFLLGVVLLICTTWLLVTVLQQSQKLESVEEQLKQIHFSMSFPPTNTNAPYNQPVISVPDSKSASPADGLESLPQLKSHTLAEINELLDPLFKTGSTREIAMAIHEASNWLYLPDVEAQADKLLKNKLGELAQRIAEEVKALDAKALKEAKGKEALRMFSQGSALMELYPVPEMQDTQSAEQLRDLLASRSLVQQKIQTAMRLRYNLWVLGRIEKGVQDLHAKRSKVLKYDDNDALLQSTSEALSPVLPDLLDAPTLELYMDFLRKTNAEIPEDYQIRLAKSLNDPSRDKRYLEEF